MATARRSGARGQPGRARGDSGRLGIHRHRSPDRRHIRDLEHARDPARLVQLVLRERATFDEPFVPVLRKLGDSVHAGRRRAARPSVEHDRHVPTTALETARRSRRADLPRLERGGSRGPAQPCPCYPKTPANGIPQRAPATCWNGDEGVLQLRRRPRFPLPRTESPGGGRLARVPRDQRSRRASAIVGNVAAVVSAAGCGPQLPDPRG